jgi:hypothetical protein
MIKKYLVAKLVEKDRDVPYGYETRTLTTYKLTYIGYNSLYDTEEEAVEEINRKISRFEKWTILPVWIEEE